MSYMMEQPQQVLTLSTIFKGNMHALVLDALFTAMKDENIYSETGATLTVQKLAELTGLSTRSVRAAVADLVHANPVTGQPLLEQDTTHKVHRYRLNQVGLDHLASCMRWP